MKKIRSRYLLNPKFQLSSVGLHIAIGLIAIGVIYYQNHYLFEKLTGLNTRNFEDDPYLMQLILNEQSSMNHTFMWTALAVILINSIGGVFLSQKVAGPIHRIHSHIENYLEGKKVSKLKFREHDYFPELADSIENLISKKKSS